MTLEDLPALAEQSFLIAQTQCGPCRDYHATWSYVRAAGLREGATADVPHLHAVLADVPETPHLLIAGSADTGQIAALAAVMHGRAFRVTLADLCETPIALCREFASRHGISFAGHRCDIADVGRFGPFDAVLCHNFLSFLDKDSRRTALLGMRAALVTTGKLVILQRVTDAANEGSPVDGSVAAMTIIQSLRSKGIPLPEEEARFAERLAEAASNTFRERRLSAFTSAAEIEAELRQAGFGSFQTTELVRAASAGTGWRRPSRRYLIVARPDLESVPSIEDGPTPGP